MSMKHRGIAHTQTAVIRYQIVFMSPYLYNVDCTKANADCQNNAISRL